MSLFQPSMIYINMKFGILMLGLAVAVVTAAPIEDRASDQTLVRRGGQCGMYGTPGCRYVMDKPKDNLV